jgi:small subunit ribosomal protein S6
MSIRRIYESTIIINAALEDNDIEAVVTRICNYIENHGGTVNEVSKWGRKRLAYPINKKYNGYYVHIVFEALPANIPIFERFLILEDTVIRHLTLVLSERLRNYRREKALAEGKSSTTIVSETDEAAKSTTNTDKTKENVAS